MWPICLGLNGFTSAEVAYGVRFRLDEILAHAHDLHYDGIEIFPFHGPYPATVKGQRELKSLYEGYELAIPALQSQTRGHASSPEQGKRDDYVESMMFNLELAHNLGTSVVGVWSGGHLPGVELDEQARWALDTYVRCTELAEEAGLTLALEPEPVQVVDSLEDLLMVLDGVCSTALKMIFDFAHVNVMSGERPLDFLAAVSGRIGHVHLTDNNGEQLFLDVEGTSGTANHLAVGDGNMDVKVLVGALRKSGYAGWVQVDVWENPDPYRASRLGKMFLDDLG